MEYQVTGTRVILEYPAAQVRQDDHRDDGRFFLTERPDLVGQIQSTSRISTPVSSLTSMTVRPSGCRGQQMLHPLTASRTRLAESAWLTIVPDIGPGVAVYRRDDGINHIPNTRRRCLTAPPLDTFRPA